MLFLFKCNQLINITCLDALTQILFCKLMLTGFNLKSNNKMALKMQMCEEITYGSEYTQVCNEMHFRFVKKVIFHNFFANSAYYFRLAKSF